MLAVPQVEWGLGRYVEQLRIFGPAFDLRMRVSERRFTVMGNVLVELLVLFGADVLLRPRPQRRSLIDRLVLVRAAVGLLLFVPDLLAHDDGQGNVVGILANDRRQTRSRQ